MTKVRALCISMSLDGFIAGPHQDRDHPVGIGGFPLFQWQFNTRAGREVIGSDGGSEGLDNSFVREGFDSIGAHVIGRNMFGPIRGEWDESWKGWWGDNPPYHHDVFVLTHYTRPSLTMEGGTTFHFVTEGIEVALERARAAAGDRDVRIGGGASTIRQYLRAGLLDELHVVSVPFVLGDGERIFDASVGTLDGYDVEYTPSESVAHVRFLRR